MPAALLAFSVYGAAAPADAQPAQGQDHASTSASQADQGTAETGPSANAAPKTADGTDTFTRPNDWQAQADPDGMTNGGVDQPGGTGGTIGSQDGNNGSGNDADCEDDNRGQGVPGHCKDTSSAAQQGDVTPVQSSEPGVPAGVPADSGPGAQAAGRPVARPVAPPAEILGISAIRPRTQPHLAVPGQVAGISASAEPTAGLLPNTGAGDLAPFGAAGLALLGGGAGLLLWRRRLAD